MSIQQYYFPNYPTDLTAGSRGTPVISEFDQVRAECRLAFQSVWDAGSGVGFQGPQGWQGIIGAGTQGNQGFIGPQGVSGAGSSDQTRALLSGWALAAGNPVIPPYAYYPDYWFDPTQPFSYGGTNYAYYLMAATASGGPEQAWFSNDFINWVGPIATSLVSGYHTEIVYVTGDPKPLKCWQWSGGGLGLLTDHYFTQSADGVTWDAPVLLTERSAGLFRRVGFCTGGYGMTCLHYNPVATNTGTDPRNYKYWGSMNGQYVPTGGEFVVPVFSADGLAWEMLPFSSFRPQADFGLNTLWADYQTTSWHPHVSWLDFDIFGDRYIGLCSGGRASNTTSAMYLCESMDGLFWNPVTYSPVAEFGWSDNNSGYRYGPLYAQYRSGNPCIWHEPLGFGAFAPAGVKTICAWSTQSGSASTTRALSTGWHT
jgi:hypothetical protein